MEIICNTFIVIMMIIILTLSCFLLDFFYTWYKLVLRKKEKELYNEQIDSIDTVDKMMDLIDRNVSIKVGHLFKEEITLQKPYNVLKLDDDISKISNLIYNELNMELFLNMNVKTKIVNDDFWLRYIIHKTTISILDIISNINLSKEN